MIAKRRWPSHTRRLSANHSPLPSGPRWTMASRTALSTETGGMHALRKAKEPQMPHMGAVRSTSRVYHDGLHPKLENVALASSMQSALSGIRPTNFGQVGAQMMRDNADYRVRRLLCASLRERAGHPLSATKDGVLEGCPLERVEEPAPDLTRGWQSSSHSEFMVQCRIPLFEIEQTRRTSAPPPHALAQCMSADNSRSKYATVFANPSRSGTVGCHWRRSLASVMSGWRCLGSSCGNGR